MKSPGIFIALSLTCWLFTEHPALGQSDKRRWYTDRFIYFYQDPRPERLLGMIEKWQSDTSQWKSNPQWMSYPPLIGFLAVIFRDYPTWIEKLIPSTLTPSSATALAGALRLSGDPVLPGEVRARIAQAGSDPILKKQLAGLPTQLSDLKVTLPTHLDILWGASFASGDGRYALQVIDFFSKIANQSNQIALDIASIASEYPGSAKEKQALTSLRKKYGDRRMVEMVFAATALWGMTSNARQHTFIKRTLVVYTSAHMGAPAAHAIILDFPQMLYWLGEGKGRLLRGI